MKSELIFSEVLFPVRSEYSNRLPGPSSSPVALLSFIHWRKALTDESPPDGTVANHILYSFSRSSCFNPKAENKDSHSNDTQELTVCILRAGDGYYIIENHLNESRNGLLWSIRVASKRNAWSLASFLFRLGKVKFVQNRWEILRGGGRQGS